MPMLSDNDIAFIRDYIGATEPPDDFELQEIYDRVGSKLKTAHVVLSKRLADYLATAASYSIVGVYQESTQANIDNLRQLLKDMESDHPELTAVAGSGNVQVTRLTRYGRAR